MSKAIELFAGVGGFRLGLERTGHEVIYANEWDRYAAQTYNKNFGGSIDTRDITTIGTDEFPDHELLVGGFPCQAFSVAGKRAGFNETRGTLFFEIARILRDKQPQHFILENVKGLLSHDLGRTFQTILGVLADLGYRVEWQVLNSKDFGVPQNRERVFIVGHLGACCGRQIFPIAESGRAHGQRGKATVGQDISAEWDSTNLEYEPRRETHAQRTPLRFLQRNQKNIEGDYAYTVDSTNTGRVKIRNTNMAGQSWDREHAGTIRAGASANYQTVVTDRIRRITPLECERLQGFPDNWTEGVSDTQRYKQMGNAVTVSVVEVVAQALSTSTTSGGMKDTSAKPKSKDKD